MAPASHPVFAKEERALCFHHELLYEAKVLDVKPVDPSDKRTAYQYKVHYKGWKATWDDWVPQDRLRKFNEENRLLATNLKRELEAMRRGAQAQKAASASHKKKVESSSARGSESRETPVVNVGFAGRKRGRDYEIEKEETFRAKPAIRLHMPDRLKSLLVDDWENITKGLQLVRLPVERHVDNILDMYKEQEAPKRISGSAEADILDEIIAGVKVYFNKALGRILLYRFERDQYLDIYRRTETPADDLANKTMSEIYGGEHLLRLFVSLPELIAQTNMEAQSVNRLREELVKITMWLNKDDIVDTVLTSEYETADRRYVEKAKGDEEHY